MNDNYRKCRTCRFCIHSEDSWVCFIDSKPTTSGGTCEKYRPGSCENCTHLSFEKSTSICSLTGEEVYILGVCSDYDPSGRRSG